jgi:beta-lactamase superfamily II metal-dependent hydrolase
MTAVFRVEMLPAREGDCIVLTYGDAAHPRRVMVDCGRKGTYRSIKKWLAALPVAERQFELLIVSHIDRDHIEGAIEMLADSKLAVSFGEVWFNGYHHLQAGDIETYGAVQGERLTEILSGPGQRWNGHFGGKSVELGRARKPIKLEDDLSLTLLSPGRGDLAALIPTWDTECKQAGLVRDVRGWREPAPLGLEPMGALDVEALAATPFTSDSSVTNATSIAVLAEFEGHRVLLAADASAERLCQSLAPLAAADGGRLRLDAFKLPHHGSKYNVSPELLAMVSRSKYLVSTNGSYFSHPDSESIARILVRREEPELIFNYRSPQTLPWGAAALKTAWGCRATYPASSAGGTISVSLLP